MGKIVGWVKDWALVALVWIWSWPQVQAGWPWFVAGVIIGGMLF